MNKLIILTAILACCSFNAFSQKNLQPAFIVLNKNDTAKGFINYREWIRNPSSIEFSLSKSGPIKKYTKDEMSAFEVIDKASYRKYSVTISLDPDRINDISEKNTETRTDEVFLKLLHEGKNVGLFSYDDEIKTRYYILMNNQANPEELKNSIYKLDGQLVNENEYRMQLRTICLQYAPTNNDLMRIIDKMDYLEKKILNVCYQLNGISESNKRLKSNKSPVVLFVGAGIDRRTSSFIGDFRYASSNSSSTSPMIIAGIDILFNPEIEKFYIHNSLSYTINGKAKATSFKKYYEATDDFRYELEQNILAFNSQLTWNMYSKPSFKVFAGAGAGANFSSYKKNTQTYHRYSNLNNDTSVSYAEDYLFLSKFWLSVSARAGVAIKNLNLSVNYTPATNIADSKTYSLKTSSLQLQLIYLFKR